MAAERRLDLNKEWSMGLPKHGQMVQHTPKPLSEQELLAPSPRLGFVLTDGAILAHSNNNVGKSVLYDPATKSIVG